MFLVGSKGAFRAHQEYVLLELRAHQEYMPLELRAPQKHVLLELRSQQTAHIESKVVILAFSQEKLLTRLNYFLYSIIYPIFYHHSEDIFFILQYL